MNTMKIKTKAKYLDIDWLKKVCNLIIKDNSVVEANLNKDNFYIKIDNTVLPKMDSYFNNVITSQLKIIKLVENAENLDEETFLFLVYEILDNNDIETIELEEEDYKELKKYIPNLERKKNEYISIYGEEIVYKCKGYEIPEIPLVHLVKYLVKDIQIEDEYMEEFNPMVDTLGYGMYEVPVEALPTSMKNSINLENWPDYLILSKTSEDVLVYDKNTLVHTFKGNKQVDDYLCKLDVTLDDILDEGIDCLPEPLCFRVKDLNTECLDILKSITKNNFTNEDIVDVDENCIDIKGREYLFTTSNMLKFVPFMAKFNDF